MIRSVTVTRMNHPSEAWLPSTRHIRWLGAVLALLTLALLQASLAKADILVNRSLSLSTDAMGATNVRYALEFTAESDDTNAVVVEFCENSPVITDACETVGGLDVTGVNTTGSDTVSQLFGQAVLIDLSATANASDLVSVELSGITNPYDPGTFYARIVTYDTAMAAEGYQSGIPGAHLDDGAVALTIINAVDVGGAVLETLEFCTSGEAFDELGCAGELSEPDLALGGEQGLSPTLATSSVFTHLSTNAASGAVVSLVSDALGCGGLVRSEDPEGCYILPRTTAGPIENGAAYFGLKFGTISGGTGAISPVGDYGQTDFFLHYEEGDESGVTSPFGDPIYTTDGGPLSGGKVELVFGANSSSTTPVGQYGAGLSLLVTGKF